MPVSTVVRLVGAANEPVAARRERRTVEYCILLIIVFLKRKKIGNNTRKCFGLFGCLERLLLGNVSFMICGGHDVDLYLYQ